MMLKKLLLLFTAVLFILTVRAQDIPPKPDAPVADFTGTLSEDEKQQLIQKLIAYDDSTSTQIAVVLIKSVGAYDINEYGTQLGRTWGIGQKGKNNGILLLVALNDRKVTIQTGYGAEGALTDAATHQIIEQDLKPNFKQGNYYAGLDAATTHIIQFMKGEYKANPKATSRRARGKDNDGGGGGAIIVIIIIVILFLIFRNRGGGGGGRIIGGRGGSSPFWWFLAGNMLGGGGRGSGWGGGSSWGGSSGGGGSDWGGFGGGSFGGGGSSGSW